MKRRHSNQVRNAFGEGSPSCNLPFPDGNLTAAEIIAYCPYWLKSVDIIDRLITNGGRSDSIAAMLNEFRVQPRSDAVFTSNSVCVMLQYAMRHGGFKSWTVGSHIKWSHTDRSEWNEALLRVSDFCTPRITHPKKDVTNRGLNHEAPPIEFIQLARHVKKHPSGPDALDLTRCVHYALDHPEEIWHFPTDFDSLVKRLGGQATITPSHCDKEAFTRRSRRNLAPSQHFTVVNTPLLSVNVRPESTMVPAKRLANVADSGRTTGYERSSYDVEDAIKLSSNERRSDRLATRIPIDHSFAFSDDTFSDNESPTKRYSKPSLIAGNKRKAHDDISGDGDFLQTDNDSSGTETMADKGDSMSDELASLRSVRPSRKAAKKARQSISDITTPRVSTKPLPTSNPGYANLPIDPVLMEQARTYQHTPVLLKPPVLSRDRLVVDARSVLLYSEEGASDIWASALSSTRFGGPRRHPPFRELYRLTDPGPMDDSDWAENIRWAKEQEKVFGSKTWTEYDYHLECITEHRRDVMWISEEVIMGVIKYLI